MSNINLSSITKYAKFFKYDHKAGYWVFDSLSQGSLKDPKQAPYVSYKRMIDEFVRDIHSLVEIYFDMNILDIDYLGMYDKIKEDIDDTLYSKNLTKTDLIAFLFYIVRRERFTEGLILSKIEDGTIPTILIQLEEMNRRELETSI